MSKSTATCRRFPHPTMALALGIAPLLLLSTFKATARVAAQPPRARGIAA